jgi:hypothetical protein
MPFILMLFHLSGCFISESEYMMMAVYKFSCKNVKNNIFFTCLVLASFTFRTLQISAYSELSTKNSLLTIKI